MLSFEITKDKEDKTRIKRKFLFWPKRFGEGNTQWWVYADIVEKGIAYRPLKDGYWKYLWREIGFLDELEEK